MERKPFDMFFNGSPRKNWNTAKVLQSAMKGAEAAGAETELVNLYELKFFGCKSCFACKIKNSKTDGVCAIRDELRPALERARKADVLVLGTPVYYSYPTGVIRSFMERLMSRSALISTRTASTSPCGEKSFRHPFLREHTSDVP